ncbi:WD repeat-containing protein 44 isoform X3 [Lingula anatina]|uniref:WD repeat-containing protein 44 n=1 Tax=Lingula anatina TaxID=7574 RepID=A0A1S3IWA7_LINAN|nr:WD repeat-containing protein 44 isoform X3 [Lingula anatina]|eukprot:XP_013402472.1 WD repeat-containing protein 44 isoform X3 [Lingula anatina]
MSSDSELDEFYDAEEDTPVKFVSGAYNKDDDLEKEERQLLELKRLAEEKRRQEDEELQKRLADIEKRKEEQLRLEAEKRLELENKKKKLEKMRKLMHQESTPFSTPSKEEEGEGEVKDTQRSTETEEAAVAIQTEQIGGGIDDTAEKRKEIVMDIHKGLSDVQEKVESVIHELTNNLDLTGHGDGSGQGHESGQGHGDTGGSGFSNFSPDLNSMSAQGDDVNLDSQTRTVEKNSAKNKTIPHIRHTGASTADGAKRGTWPKQGSYGGGGGDRVRIDSDSENEPDIVRSTKHRSAVEMPAPVAPPRRRKKIKSMAEEVSLTPTPPEQPSGLPKSTPQATPTITPTCSVENLTKALDHCLDLNSAVQGDRHVTTMALDAHATKGEGEALMTPPTAEETPPPSSNIIPDSSQAPPTPSSGSSSVPQPDVEVKDDEGKEKQGAYDIEIAPGPRPRSNSGRLLSDKEILDSIIIRNLDTGESLPLSLAEEQLPQGTNPLALHIMRRTKEYASDSSLEGKERHPTDEVDAGPKSVQAVAQQASAGVKKTGTRLKKLFGKTVSKIKSVAGGNHDDSSSDEEVSLDGKKFVKGAVSQVKASGSNKGPYDFAQLKMCQDLSGEHVGAVWIMKFSHCGRLVATGGQDNILRVWVLKNSFAYFDDMRQKYSEASASLLHGMRAKVSPAPSQESLDSVQSADAQTEPGACGTTGTEEEEEEEDAPFMKKPLCTYRGHSGDVLDLSWSKNYFILSSSMDKTVRLWHISRRECLCCFQHIDFVTAIVFHPKDDRYFLSGSLDGTLRLWNIPDKKVALWNEVSGHTKLITAANFCQNGKFAVVGTYDGRCIFYSTDQLKYYTLIHVRSTRGRNARGRKISGIEPMPGEDKVLVTSNDSRIRLYDLRDLTLTCKYKGCANTSSQIKAGFSHNGKHIICGSEDQFIYIWKTQHEFHKFSSARRDRNDFWEGIKAHNAVVTAAIFAPNPSLLLPPTEEATDTPPGDHQKKDGSLKRADAACGDVFLSADFTGAIKVFTNHIKRQSSSTSLVSSGSLR